METKTIRTEFKADGEGEGRYTALVSAFGNVDSYNDRVVKGAFAGTLERWAAKGDPIPVVFSHRWDDPTAIIGTTLDAEETDKGLVTSNQLDMGYEPAARVFGLLKSRIVTNHSFAYDVLEADDVEEQTDDGAKAYVRELKALDLFEHGPCLVGVNQATDTLAAKTASVLISAELKGVLDRLATVCDHLASLNADESVIVKKQAEHVTTVPGGNVGDTADAPGGQVTESQTVKASAAVQAELRSLEIDLISAT